MFLDGVGRGFATQESPQIFGVGRILFLRGGGVVRCGWRFLSVIPHAQACRNAQQLSEHLLVCTQYGSEALAGFANRNPTKKVAPENCIQQDVKADFFEKSAKSVEEGVQAKPIVASTANKHWSDFRKMVSVLQQEGHLKQQADGGGVVPKEVFTRKHLEAYFVRLQNARTPRGERLAPATGKTIWGSISVLIEVLMKGHGLKDKQERRRANRKANTMQRLTRRLGGNLEWVLAGPASKEAPTAFQSSSLSGEDLSACKARAGRQGARSRRVLHAVVTRKKQGCNPRIRPAGRERRALRHHPEPGLRQNTEVHGGAQGEILAVWIWRRNVQIPIRNLLWISGVDFSFQKSTKKINPESSEKIPSGFCTSLCLTKPRNRSWNENQEKIQKTGNQGKVQFLGYFFSFHVRSYCGTSYFFYSKDPAVLKTLQDSELLRRSVFVTPPVCTTLRTLF